MEKINYAINEESLCFEKTEEKNAYSVRRREGCTLAGNLEIPAAYCGLPVTEIGDCAFEFSDIVNVKIPNSIERIGKSAFSDCRKLESAVLPKEIDAIPDFMFYNCERLAGVAMPERLRSIGESAFEFCSALESIVIPYGTELIWDSAFSYCSKIKSIELPETLTFVGCGAFDLCNKLIEVINRSRLPVEVGSRISGGVAYYALEVHTGKSKVEESGDLLFYTLGEKKYLASYTGASKNPVLPEKYDGKIYSVYDYAFKGCFSESIAIPEGVFEIGKYAFYSCPYLCEISLPRSVTTISEGLFLGCTSLKTFTLSPYVTEVCTRAFSSCTALVSITLPDSIEAMGERVFSDCISLKEIALPKKITEIPFGMFYGCKSLQKIYIPESVKRIGEKSFSRCFKLSEIHYGGTISQWKAICKEWERNTFSGKVEIICTDGRLTEDRHLA